MRRSTPSSPWQSLRPWPVALAASLLASAALVAPVWAAPSILITPSVSVSQTITNNVALASTGQTGDAVTQVELGLGLRSRQGMVTGFLDYSLSGLVYVRRSELNDHRHSLNSRATLEWYDRQGFVEISSSVGRAALSAFSVQPGAEGLSLANSSEVRNLHISPSWKGQFGPEVAYSIKADYGLSSTQGSDLGDGHSSGLSLRLGSAKATRLGWSVDALHTRSSYGAGRSTQSDRVVGTGRLLLPEFDLELSTNLGYERSNLNSLATSGSATWGMGAVWTPTPRTQLSAQFEDRPFGNTHSLSLRHRTPLTVWTLTDTRSLSTNGNQLGAGLTGTLYDLFFTQFASLEPDLVKRADMVNSFLRAYGLDPNAGLGAGQLSSAATIQANTSLSVAARGVRSTATLTLSRGTSRRADTLSAGVDDLSSAARIVSKAVSLNLAHRLTPLSNLSLTLTLLDNQGGQGSQSLRQRMAQLQYSDQLAKNANWGLALRRTLYETSLVPFAESAAVLTFGLRF